MSCATVISPIEVLSNPRVEQFHEWLMVQRYQMSKNNPVAKAINYMLEKDGRWEAFTRFLDDGRLCLSNNAAERALRGIALGRKAWLFAGSQRGGERAAFMYSLIVSAIFHFPAAVQSVVRRQDVRSW